jgi:hypothetical protein
MAPVIRLSATTSKAIVATGEQTVFVVATPMIHPELKMHRRGRLSLRPSGSGAPERVRQRTMRPFESVG